MTAPSSALRVGWCPGTLRPMPAGDGLLLRVKPRGQRLLIGQARGIATLAARFGNGALTLTARGNIQLRGVAEARLPALTDALGALDLVDGSAEGEAVRNVLSNPLAGADPTAPLDLRPAVATLEDRLVTDTALWRLPAKFAWSVDAGGRLSLAGSAADVCFTALPGTTTMAVMLDGDRAYAVCRQDVTVAVAVRLAEAFLALCAEAGLAPHRMRDLVAVVGAPRVLRRSGLSAEPRPDRPASTPPSAAIGCHRHGPWSFVGAAPAFGLLDAATLDGLAVCAAEAGAADLRLTPWRSLLVPALDEKAAKALAAGLAATSLILDPADPRLAVAACVGEPACHRATTAVPDDAARLATLVAGGRGIRLHVSGCTKGCAYAGPAPLTLVGRAGRYDLVRDGRAGDLPIAAGLDIDALSMALPAMREMAS